MREFSEEVTVVRMDNGAITYACGITQEGYLLHCYFGAAIGDDDISYLMRLSDHPFTPNGNNRDRLIFMDSRLFEFPCHGTGDYREPCLMVLDEDGMSTCDLRVTGYRTVKGKPALKQKGVSVIPATDAAKDEAETLVITLEDAHLDLTAELTYTMFTGLPVVTRSARVINHGYNELRIQRLLSGCVEWDHSAFDMITLNGTWARERAVSRVALHSGKQSVDSKRGISSHQHNPFAALVSHDASEESGEAYGFNLVYSGNFLAEAEVATSGFTRFVMGINPFDFSWLLRPEEDLTAPELVMVYSDKGIGAMSRTFHDLYRGHLIRGQWKDKMRPVLINNWEATYFNFDEEKLYAIAKTASEKGIEMLVLDDGWFGKRNYDDCSLGDWVVNEEKLKGGLKPLVDRINALGMKFGLWFEPEMVSPDSDLYRAHPEWAIQIIGRDMTQAREQYVLDYSNPEVREYVYGQIRAILDSANVEYIKWDMNRALSEVGSTSLPRKRQRELWHRYVLGVYEVMDRLTTDYPYLLLENCSSGGARFDPGMLYFSPQIWTSDDTDAIERIKIQYGTSLCYPASAMGAHVSDCPNHILGRTTPFATRGDVALVGTFGYELDVTRIPEEDREAIPGQIAKFKKFNPLVRTGDWYRLGNPFEDDSFDAWMFVAKDRSEAVFTFVQILNRPSTPSRRILLRGLDPKKVYRNEDTGEIRLGETWMKGGVIVGAQGDFASRTMHFTVC
ncbi:MAG: alpha-galactosidase [Lachnospiraceae bacterium]|nr:alpha-galactosidase [Lachnospiraceae bacterium]